MRKRIDEQKKPTVTKARHIVTSFAVSMAMLVAMPTLAYADKFSDAAKGAAEGIQASVSGATRWLIMIALVVVGLAVAFGTQRQRDGAKERLPYIAVGVALIVGGLGISSIVWGWFQ